MRAALFTMRATNSSLVFTFSFVDFAFHPSPQTKIRSVRANFRQLYLHTHWKLNTCLYELIYSEQSILPPPKIFTNLSETPCIICNSLTHFHCSIKSFSVTPCCEKASENTNINLHLIPTVFVTGWNAHKFTMESRGIALLHQASKLVQQ